MKIMRKSRRHVPKHGEPVILFAVAGQTFAAAANEVDEIRELSDLQWVGDATRHTSAAKVKAILEKGDKKYYAVEATQHFRLPASKPSRLIVLRDYPIAVLVDSIDRMTEIQKLLPLPRAFNGNERDWYVGLALMGETVVPVVKMAAFLSPAEQVIARSIVTRIPKGVTA